MVSNRRSSNIPSDGLESEDLRGNPEAKEGAGFQLLELIHEEGDPETSAAVSCKVSTRSEESRASSGSARNLGQHTVKKMHMASHFINR